MITLPQIRAALATHATITIDHEPEPDDSSELAMHFEDPADVEWVLAELRKGNTWAWCSITVRATWGGMKGVGHLGACSYRSREDFEKPGGYYTDMVGVALDRLAEQVARICHATELLCAGKVRP